MAGPKEPMWAANPAMAATAVAITEARPARRRSRWSWRKYSGDATHMAWGVRAGSAGHTAPTAAGHQATARRERWMRGRSGPAAYTKPHVTAVAMVIPA